MNTFQQRCQKVGLYEGSLFAWLDKVEQLTAERDDYKQGFKDALKKHHLLRAERDRLRAALESAQRLLRENHEVIRNNLQSVCKSIEATK